MGAGPVCHLLKPSVQATIEPTTSTKRRSSLACTVPRFVYPRFRLDLSSCKAFYSIFTGVLANERQFSQTINCKIEVKVAFYFVSVGIRLIQSHNINLGQLVQKEAVLDQ